MYRPGLLEILLRLIPGTLLLGASLGGGIAVDLNIALAWWWRVLLYVAVVLLSLLSLRIIAIGAVMTYQKLASEETRNACRFEPTCSVYMILALRKYGFLIGLCKGLGRISRCHPPYGGVDYP